MRRVACSLAVAAWASGCLGTPAFRCAKDAACTHQGQPGTCEPAGYCSFPDLACPSGRRYGTYAAELASGCVVPLAPPPDAGPDGLPPDPIAVHDPAKDAFDGLILGSAQLQGWPDALLVKAQIQVSSGYDVNFIGNGTPCGIPNGWTAGESTSFGLLAITPACGEATPARLPNGHPNLTQDPQSPLWPTSVFNPAINIDAGIATNVKNWQAFMGQFPGCTGSQYIEMAMAAYFAGAGDVTGCGAWGMRGASYVTAVLAAYRMLAMAAGLPNPY